MNAYCVYTHSLDGEVFYVGAGVESRPYDLSTRSNLWMEFASDRRKEVNVEIIGEFHLRADALKFEQETILLLNPRCNTRHMTPKVEVKVVTFRMSERWVSAARRYSNIQKITNPRFSFEAYIAEAVITQMREDGVRVESK